MANDHDATLAEHATPISTARFPRRRTPRCPDPRPRWIRIRRRRVAGRRKGPCRVEDDRCMLEQMNRAGACSVSKQPAHTGLVRGLGGMSPPPRNFCSPRGASRRGVNTLTGCTRSEMPLDPADRITSLQVLNLVGRDPAQRGDLRRRQPCRSQPVNPGGFRGTRRVLFGAFRGVGCLGQVPRRGDRGHAAVRRRVNRVPGRTNRRRRRPDLPLVVRHRMTPSLLSCSSPRGPEAVAPQRNPCPSLRGAVTATSRRCADDSYRRGESRP